MDIITLGSKIVDDCVISSKGKLRNLERIVEISPFSFSESVNVSTNESEKERLLNTINVPNDYMRYLFRLDFFKEVFEKIESQNYELVTIDFTSMRIPVHEFIFADGFKFKLTENITLKENMDVIRKFLENKCGKIISERVLTPFNYDDELLKIEIKKFLSKLFFHVNREKIVYLKINNVSQYISKENNIEILPNQNVINITNSFYKRCEEIAADMLDGIIALEYPQYVIGDEHIMHPNMFNYNKNYYEYLVESILAIMAGNYSNVKNTIRSTYEIKQKVEIEDISMIPLLYKTSIKAKGRKIIVIGHSDSFNYALKKRYGLSVYKNIKWDASADIAILEKELREIENGNADFFCVVPYLYNNVDVLSVLWKYGYGYAIGYICALHKPYILKDFVGHYTDIFNNEVDSCFPCTIQLQGGGNKIVVNGGDGGNMNIIALNNVYISIEENVCIADNFSMRTYDGAIVKISEGTKIGRDAHIRGGFFTKTEIGKNCNLGDRVIVFNGDGHAIIDLNSGKNINYAYRNLHLCKHQIEIGEHVHIGDDTFILSGTYIGKDSVIRENSLLNKMFGESKYIGGHPAVVMEDNITWRS